MPIELKFFFAIFSVLVLAGVAMWLVRRFNAGRIGSATGTGRMPRLAVVSAAEFGDGRRKLVLVRRDNVEHLVMIGGPNDVVVEPNIQRTAPIGRDTRAPSSDPSWLDNEPTELREPAPMPMPEPPPRQSRPLLAGDEPRRGAPPPISAPPMPAPERRPEPIAGFAPDPASRAAPPMRSPPPRPPMPRPPVATQAAPPVVPPVVAPASEPASQADQNLAEMAQRLEAALRRPGAEPGPAVAINPVDRIGAPPVAPEAAPQRKTPPVEPPKAAEPKPESGFESLEAEMANLLGRPKNPS